MTPQEIVRLLRSAPAGKSDEELSSPLEDKWERPPIFITPGIPGSLSELPARCLGDEEIVAGFTPIREAPDEIAPPLPMDSDCCFEVPVDILERLPRRPAEVSPLVPDISAGLGHRQEKYEMKQLELFAIEQLELRVYNGDLCEFRPPCWTRLDSRACTICLKELFRQHSLDTHLGTSDYRSCMRFHLTVRFRSFIRSCWTRRLISWPRASRPTGSLWAAASSLSVRISRPNITPVKGERKSPLSKHLWSNAAWLMLIVRLQLRSCSALFLSFLHQELPSIKLHSPASSPGSLLHGMVSLRLNVPPAQINVATVVSGFLKPDEQR